MAKVLETWEVQPHDRLEEIDDGILTVAGEIRMPLGNFPRRMTVVRLSGGRIALYSAIALEEPEMARIEAMGAPAVMIVPSAQHRMDAKIWKQRYPHIRVIAPSGAREGVGEVVPVDATEDTLGDRQVRFAAVPGTGRREAALKIRRAGGVTIVCNDLIANVAHPHGLGAQIMGRLMHFGVSAPQMPLFARHALVEDRAALAQQFREWAMEPDLRRIIVSHGDPIVDEPAGVLTRLAATLD